MLISKCKFISIIFISIYFFNSRGNRIQCNLILIENLFDTNSKFEDLIIQLILLIILYNRRRFLISALLISNSKDKIIKHLSFY